MPILALLAAAMLAAAAPSPLETARNQQNRPALEKLVADASAAAAKAPNNAAAQYSAALTCSYLAEVAIEQRDRKLGRQVAEQGIRFAEKAVALDSNQAEHYRVLATLYGQAVTDLFSGLSYGPKAKQAINTAVTKAPNSSTVYVARGVGNYYLPAQVGGGTALAITDFRKAIELDAKNADAWLWLGLALRKDNQNAEAQKAFKRSLQLNPDRVWARQQLEKTPAK